MIDYKDASRKRSHHAPVHVLGKARHLESLGYGNQPSLVPSFKTVCNQMAASLRDCRILQQRSREVSVLEPNAGQFYEGALQSGQ